MCESWYVVDIIFFHMLTEWSFMTLFSILNGLLVKVVFYYTHTSMHIYTLIKQNPLLQKAQHPVNSITLQFSCVLSYTLLKKMQYLFTKDNMKDMELS